MALEFVQARVDLPIVELPGPFTNTPEHERFEIQSPVDTKNIEDNSEG
jgi:hypothetical protein